jgi:hypothetical protein
MNDYLVDDLIARINAAPHTKAIFDIIYDLDDDVCERLLERASEINTDPLPRFNSDLN